MNIDTRRQADEQSHLKYEGTVNQAVEGLLAISDFQRRRVFQRLRPAQRQLTKMRTARRRRPDGTLSPGGTLSAAPSRRPSVRSSAAIWTRALFSFFCSLTIGPHAKQPAVACP